MPNTRFLVCAAYSCPGATQLGRGFFEASGLPQVLTYEHEYRYEYVYEYEYEYEYDY